MSENFCHLHVHSEFSLLDGLCKVDKIFEKVKSINQKAVSITEHGNMDSYVKAIKASESNGIKYIPGCEMYIVDDIEAYGAQKRGENKLPRKHLTLWAKNNIGVNSMFRLLGVANKNFLKGRPTIAWSDLFGDNLLSKNVIAGTACTSGVILADDSYYFEIILDAFNDVYLEVMPHIYDDQIALNLKAIEYSKKYSKKIIAVNDVHYVEKNHDYYQEVLLAIQSKKTWDDPKRWKFNITGLYLKSYDEMFNSFKKQKVYNDKQIKEFLGNTIDIVGMSNCKFSQIEVKLPQVVNKGEDPDDILIGRVMHGFKNILDRRPEIKLRINEYINRLEEELVSIIKLGFCEYFILVDDIVKWSKENDILIGACRGSVGGSLVAYCLGITSLDSIEYGLLFARFISPSRIDLPDIDIDFEDAKRDRIKSYLKNRFGDNKVASVSTFSEMHGRGVLRDVSRVFKVPMADVDSAAKAIVVRSGGDVRSSFTIEDTFNTFEEGKKFIAKYPEVSKTAMALEGVVKNIGMHAAGVVISINDFDTGMNGYLRKTNRGDYSINWDKDDLEYMGLIKLDILGLNFLTILNKARALIRERGNGNIDFPNIKFDDDKIFKEFNLGNTTGIFQFNCITGDAFIGIKSPKRMKDIIAGDIIESITSDGKIVFNRVKRKVFTGKKKVYLVNIKGYAIKATENHKFKTGYGWKELKDLKVGDYVLIADLGYSYCPCGCGTIKTSRCENKFFPYFSWVRGHQNRIPNKSIRTSDSVKELWKDKEYRDVQCADRKKRFSDPNFLKLLRSGICKKSDDYKRERSDIFRRLWKNKYYRDNQIKAIKRGWKSSPVRQEMIGNNRGGGSGKIGFREDIGHFVRSTWEANFARFLRYEGIDYSYESDVFYLENGETYRPDFKIEKRTYVETKGYMDENSRRKIDLFKKSNPRIELILVEKEEYNILKSKYENLIDWENTETQYLSISRIQEWGEEDTYDIEMADEPRNFIANGISVHNSYGIRKLCTEVGINSFKDLSDINALFRPGTLRSGLATEYCKRKKGDSRITYIHPILEKLTGETYGIILYQEQIMNMLYEIGGLSWKSTDMIRKVVSKAKGEEQFMKFEKMFVDGCLKKRTLTEEEAKKVFNELKYFGCLTGDTIIYRASSNQYSNREITINELYSYQNSTNFKFRKLKIHSMYDDRMVKINTVNRVIYTGKKNVYRVTTLSGKTIKATSEHKFLTEFGWKRLKNIRVGFSLVCTDFKRQKKSYIRTGTGSGAHNEWHGKFLEREEARGENIGVCELCGSKKFVELYHKDGDSYNNSRENRLYICRKCHRKEHNSKDRNTYSRFKVGLETYYDEVIGIEDCGFENTYDIEMSGDPRNFIANGIVVHNSYGFNKAHSVGYAAIAYWGMYVKVYYPEEFFESLLTWGTAEKKIQTYIDELKRVGFKINPVDINKSDIINWSVKNKEVYPPISILKGVGEKACESIGEWKKHYGKITEKIWLENSNINRRVVNSRVRSIIADSGALSSLGADYSKIGYKSYPYSWETKEIVSKLHDLFSDAIGIDKLGDKLSKEEKWYFAQITETKFGYHAKVHKQQKVDQKEILGGADSLGGVYGYARDIDGGYQMITFKGSLYMEKKYEIEHSATKWALFKGNPITFSENIIVNEVYFEDEIMSCNFGKLKLPLYEEIKPKLNKNIEDCIKCSLRKECAKPVMSEYRSNIAILGEAPGRKEDGKGLNFYGQAGEKVWKIFKDKYNLFRENFSIFNTVKCWPSITKNPKEQHIESCSEWLDEDIEKIKPILILSFGRIATEVALGEEVKISEISGQCFWSYRFNCWIVPCIHPASVLYGGFSQKDLEDGIDKFIDKLEIFI